MSRSRRKNPFIGHTTASSDKKDKAKASRSTRRANAVRLKRKTEDFEDFSLLSNVAINGMGNCMFAKDGKQRINPADPHLNKYMRK